MLKSSFSFQRRLIAWSYWVSTFSEGASQILIPLYFASLGIAITKIAVMFVFYEFFGLITHLYAGFFINKYGYKRAFILSLLFHTFASLGYLFLFQGPFILTIVLVNILRAFRGIGKELIKTTSGSYFRHLANSHLHTNLLFGGKESLKGLGILFGSILLTYFSFSQSFLMLGFSTLVCFIICMVFIVDYKESTKVSVRNFFNVSNKLSKLAVIRSFLYAGRDVWLVLALPVYLSGIGVSHVKIGLMLAVGFIVFGLVQPLTGLFVKKKIFLFGFNLKEKWFYEDIIPISSFVLLLIPLCINVIRDEYVLMFGLVVLYNIFAGFATAPHNYLHIRLSNFERASVDISYYTFVSQFGKVIAVFASGVIFDFFGLRGCLLASTACLFVSGILGSLLASQVSRDKFRKKLEKV